MLVSDYSLQNRLVNHSFHRGHHPDPGTFICEVNGEMLSVKITWHNYLPPTYCPNCGKYLSPSNENLYVY
jgi:hypothetical protein